MKYFLILYDHEGKKPKNEIEQTILYSTLTCREGKKKIKQ